MAKALRAHPRDYSGARTVFGATFSGNTRDTIQRYLYLFGVWEPEITRWTTMHLRRDDCVVDVGANIGYFSLLAASCVGSGGQVHAFEAVPSIAHVLRANIREAGANVIVHDCAVGAHVGEIAVFRGASHNLGHSGTRAAEGSQGEGTVRLATLVDELPKGLWPKVTLVKIDVEGDELNVLRGMQPLLAAMPTGSALLVEVTPEDLAARGQTPNDVVSLLFAHGFTSYKIHNSYAPEDYLVKASGRAMITPCDVPNSRCDLVFLKGAGA